MSVRTLASARWPEVSSDAIVLVPLGSTEQHGPHLPLATDAMIASTVSEAVAERLGPRALVAPTLPFGSSGEHEGFPGTISIGNAALRDVVVELGRSISLWATRVILVNAHGGNVPVVRDAVLQLRGEGRPVAWVACVVDGADPHAGRTETSLMLHIDSGSVRMDHAEAGPSGSLEDLMAELVASGVRAVSPNGVLGDPSGASAREGRRLLDQITKDVWARITRDDPDARGRL